MARLAVVAILSLQLLLLANTALASLTPEVCPNGWALFSGRCWQYVSSSVAWQTADSNCRNLDGTDTTLHLADPRTAAENTFVNNLGCINNTAFFPSAWNVWLGSTSLTINSDGTWANINTAPVPKFVCVCQNSITPSGNTLCVSSISANPGIKAGVALVGTCSEPTAVNGTGCTGQTTTNFLACRVPPTPSPVPNNMGRGMCWLNGGRSGIGSTGTLQWSFTAPTVSKVIGGTFQQGRVEPNLIAFPTTAPTQAQYTRTPTPAYSPTSATPNCLAIWNYNREMWVLDYCQRSLPYVCVRDANCLPGYFKSLAYSVDSTGNVQIGTCTKCSPGKFRSTLDDQALCRDCAAGYYGNGTNPRTTSTCDGPCPAGTFCTGGTSVPTQCSPGTYGKPLINAVTGPGYTTEADACLPCTPGFYCDRSGMVAADLKLCSAGFCGYDKQTSPTCSRQCMPGYYCPGGQANACPGRPCGDGASGGPVGANAYCPDGSTSPQTVPAGHYSLGGNTTSTNSAILPCSPGFYCQSGVRVPCPLGFYSGAEFTVAERVACKTCRSGYYCPPAPDAVTPASTSAFQQFCAPSGDPNPATYYCINGTRAQIPVSSTTLMTIPVDAPLNIRENVAPCPANKICEFGIAYDRVSWVGCPGGQASVSIPELWASRDTNWVVNASLFRAVNASDFVLDYRVLNQTFANPSDLLRSKVASCRALTTINDGIFDVNATSGRLQVRRFAPNATNPAGALQYEACEPITDMRYVLILQASARQRSGPLQANITCAVTVSVTDANDQPLFSQPVYHRFIPESAPENTPASRCTGIAGTVGCPDDSSPLDDPSVSAVDEDFFGQGNLDYSFVGNLSAAQDKLKINSCTGLLSQKAGLPLRYSDPTIPFVSGTLFKRINYTIRAQDDGNGGLFPIRAMDTLVYVYIQNVNDRPIFLVNSSIDIWIAESTSARRTPAGTRTTPDTFPVFDDDPQDITTVTIVKNDGQAFDMVNGSLRTSVSGERDIDFESNKKIYSIDLEVRDNGVPSLATTLTVNIRVANLNDPPRIEQNLVFYVPENTPANTPVCRDQSGVCTVPDPQHAIKSTDQDNIETDVTTYSLTINPGNIFQINTTSGQVSLALGNSLNFENEALSVSGGTGRGYTLQVQASSNGVGVVTQPGLTTFVETDVRNFTVFIVDVNENPVFVTPTNTVFRVVETWPVGRAISYIQIQAVDPDNADILLFNVAAPTQKLTFSLSDTSSGAADGAEYFAVTNDPTDNTMARISVRKALDFETAPDCAGGTKCYTLRLRVTDDGGPVQGVGEQVYTITLVNVNEAPVFSQNTFTLSAAENLTFGLRANLTSSTPIIAYDPDFNGNNTLTYAVLGGDGFAQFGIASLGVANGVQVFKFTNVLLDFETKNSYFLRLQVVDNGGGSSAIGKACTLDQGVSVGCGSAAFCQGGQCYETCPSYSNNTLTIASANVPRRDFFFCQDLSLPPFNMTRDAPPFRETAEATIVINLSDENDDPYIVDRAIAVPQPTILDNINCTIKAVISENRITVSDQFPVQAFQVWDDDKPNPGPRAAPFTFSTAGGVLWSNFQLNNTVTGRIKFPVCTSSCGAYVAGTIYTGLIRVTDQAGGTSTCTVVVNITATNVPPSFPGDVTVAPVSEFADVDFVVRNAYTTAELNIIDPDTLSVTPDNLTFSTTFSQFFNVAPDTAMITLKQPLDYESLFPSFARTVLIRVVDRAGAEDVMQVTVPVKDENEAPFWDAPVAASGALEYSIAENTAGLTVVADLAGFPKDPDTFSSNATWRTLSLSIVNGTGCNTSCPFQLSNSQLVVKSGAVLDFETLPNTWTFNVRATDGPGLFGDLRIRISLTDVNEAPVFIGTASVAVNEGNGGPTGRDFLDMSLFVRDPDSYDPISSLRYNITDANANTFQIVSGMLRLAPNRDLDYEAINVYNVSLSVSDTGGLSSVGFFVVQVTNVNDVTVTAVTVISGPNAASQQLACNGQTSRVRIVGTNLGMVSGTPKANITLRYRRSIFSSSAPPNFTTSNCNVTVANTVAECDIVSGGAGVGLLFDVVVSVPSTQILSDGINGFSTSIAFPTPVISGVSGSTLMNTAGGQSLTITGTCLGGVADAITFGATSTDSSVELCTLFDGVCRAMSSGCVATSTTGSTIVCTAATLAGLGASTSFRVRTARSASGAFVSGGYGRPSISNVSLATLRTDGTLQAGLILNGTNFGPMGSLPDLAVFYYNDSTGTLLATYRLLGCSVSRAFVQVTCLSHDPGVGFGMRIELTFAGQTNPSSPLVSFEAPVVTRVATDGNALSPTPGGIFVTITGSSFGPPCGVPGINVAAGAVNCGFIRATYSRNSTSVITGQPIVYTPLYCAVISQVQVVCTTVEGTGRNLAWRLTVGGQEAFVSPSSGFTGYSTPVVGAYSGPGASGALTSGLQFIDLAGFHFGPVGGAPVSAQYGNELNPTEFTAVNCTVTQPHVLMRCFTGVGAGAALSWKVTVDGQLSRSRLSDYGPPIVSQVLLGSNPATALRDDGGEAVTLVGLNFGPPGSTAYLESVTYGPFASRSLYDVTSRCVVLSHESIQCLTLPGLGSNLIWRVVVRGQAFDAVTAVSSFAVPTLTNISATTGRSNGGELVDLTGSAFGVCDRNVRVRVAFGTTLVDVSSVFRQGSIDPINLAATCNPGLPLAFGPVRRLRFAVPEMTGSNTIPVTVQLDSIVFPGGVFRTSQTFTYVYRPPSISDVYAEPGPTPGDIFVTLTGSNFCRSEACCQTYLDGSIASSFVTVHTHERITFLAKGPGATFVRCPGGDTAVQVFSSQNPFVYGAVRVTDFQRLDAVTFGTLGGEDIYVFSLFAGSSATVAIGGRSATVVNIDTFLCDSVAPGFVPSTVDIIQAILVPNQMCTRIQARVPPGEGTGNQVVITVGSLRSRADDPRFQILRYTPPAINSLSASFSSSYATSGDLTTLLTVTGTNFGLGGKILFGPASFDNTRNEISCDSNSPGYNWTHTSVSCFVPPGEGLSLDIRVRAGSQVSPVSAAGKLQYRRPVISSFSILDTTDNLADTIGGQTMVITGTNFGRPYNASAIATSPGQLHVVTLGPSAFCSVISSSHTEIFCSVPPGEGRALPLTLTVAGDLPAVVSSSQFSYGPPQVFSVTPSNGQTNGLDANGNRQIIQITGKNFGVDLLRVQFGTVNGFVLLGRRSARDFVDDFLYPGTNHTSIRVYLPAYFGSNLNISVTVASLVSNDTDSPKFSYAAPIINNVTSSRGGRQLETVSTISTDDWVSGNTTLGGTAEFGECLPVKPDNSSVSQAVTTVFRQKLTITTGGAFVRVFRFYSLPNYTSADDAACADVSRFAGEATQSGTFTDLGEHPTLGCMRTYRSDVTTLTGTVPVTLFPNGGYGYYVISERKDLYISLPSFGSYDDLVRGVDAANFEFENGPSASLRNGLPPQNLTLIPTSGCNGWESDAAYKARVDAAFTSGATQILPRKCLFPVLLQVSGENFGSGDIAPPGALRVYLVDERGIEYEGSTTSSAGNHGLVCDTSLGCLHTDTLIIFQAPFGSGRGLFIRVVLGDQNKTSAPLIDYIGPDVYELVPGTLSAGSTFLNAAGGEGIRVLGDNLGYLTSMLSVIVNGRPCQNTTWLSGFTERSGRASIQCQSAQDVPGIKSLFVCVGGQGKMSLATGVVSDTAALQYGQARGFWNTTSAPNLTAAVLVRALAVARCPAGTYGRIGELCLPCPEGANCYPGFDLPVPKATFSILTLGTTSKRATEGACPSQRLDRSLALRYPEMSFYDTCNQVVRCIPPGACESAGVCAPGYEYQLYRCRAKRNATSNACRVFFDPAVGVHRGVDSDCQLNTPPGQTCSFDHPEDCSTCKVNFATADPASAFGTCTCTQPQRCALCTATTHYRLNNECIPCPDNPGLIFALFILAGVSCIALAYYLQKRKINLAFLSIGVDYFQVLAVLSTTNVPWPPFIRDIFKFFSLFLASIDIVAPECLVPNLEFPTKFYLTELLPVLALFILLAIHAGYTVYKVYKLGKQAKWLSHVSRLMGIYILILYVLYLSLTKKALDVFNCNPLDPDDGYSYTAFSSLSCDGGGLCRCFEPGGLQDSLVAPAIIFLGVYTFGFPLFVAWIVFYHRENIREDQYLRANELGDRRETNPRAYDVRKRYQLMYMHFKPKYSFWMLAILARKFGVAFASLMFRGNPSFQLAVILVVLFVSFTLQVSLRPYMSPGEFPVVVKELNDNSKRADEEPEDYAIYRDLFRKVSESMRTQAELARREKMVRHKMGAGFWEESKQAAREHDKRSVAEKYFFDLNAVEAVLLGATIIIALSGIMFESGRFQTTRSDIAWQGNLVVVLVFIVLFGSLGYYLLVFINELWPIAFARYCGRLFLRYQNDGVTNEELDKMKDNDIVLDANPLFAAAGPVGDKSKTLQKEIDASKEALALAKRQNEELKRLKAELENSGSVTARNPLALRELMNTGSSS